MKKKFEKHTSRKPKIPKWKKARIIANLNSLVDEGINELYKASQAGVEIDLIVEAFVVRPGIKASVKNQGKGIVGRFRASEDILFL